MAHMRDDAHNGLPRGIVSIANALSKSILIGPILVGEILVNDGHRLSAQAVLIGEDAATEQPDTHGLEIARADAANIAVWPRITRRRHASFDVEGCGTSESAERQWHSRSRGDDTGGIGEPLPRATEERNLLVRRIAPAGPHVAN